ncbi:MAG: saccharopine dehydrogenase NADP-binding domain-containing protein [Planctomycetes bacterium]|nr:saccharopine dehydrogenase NADP-binding domain-containing protein [Planctomycetota bacterium]
MRRRVVVLGGAGAMGRITLGDLRDTARDLEPVLCDRDPGAARALGVEGRRVDVTDARALRRALSGAFAVIASLPYRFNLEAMRGALAARAHYVDLGGLFHVTREQLRLGGAFEEAGRLGLLGMGSAPGILNVLAVRAAEGLERVREVHCMVGAAERGRRPHGDEDGDALGFGYSPDTLLDEFLLDAAVFRAGDWAMVPPLDPRERVRVRFPAPIGAQTLDATLHSEVATLPRAFADRGVREVTFRQSFEPGFAERLRLLGRLGLLDPAPLPRLGVAPRQVLLALLARQAPPAPNGAGERHEVLRVVVRGRRARRAVEVTADCLAGPDAGGGVGPDIDTGAPPSIAVQLLASGELEARPGVWAPEDVVPVRPFLRELERRGMRVRVRRRAAAPAAAR